MIREIRTNFIEVKDVQIRDLQCDKYFLAFRLIVKDAVETTEIYNEISKKEEITAIKLYS